MKERLYRHVSVKVTRGTVIQLVTDKWPKCVTAGQAKSSKLLHHMVEIEWQMINRPSFSDMLRDVAMATNLVAKMGQNYLLPALIVLSFRNGMVYRLAKMRINSSTNCSTSNEKMVKIGLVVFESK